MYQFCRYETIKATSAPVQWESCNNDDDDTDRIDICQKKIMQHQFLRQQYYAKIRVLCDIC